MTLTADNDNDDIIEKFPNCAPLYKLWLLKFLKYHESNKPNFRTSKGVQIFDFIHSELDKCAAVAVTADSSNVDSIYSQCALFNRETKMSDNVDFFTAIKKRMVANHIFVETAIAIDKTKTSPLAEIGPRKKLKFIQAIFESESRDITKNIVTKLLQKVPFMDIVWYCALRRKEIAFLQMDSLFTEIGKPRIGPVPRIPGMRFDMYPDSTSPVIECNGAHLIPYMTKKIGIPNSMAYYITEHLEHEPSTEFTLTVLEAQETNDDNVYEYFWHHFQENGKQRIQKIFDTLEFLYTRLVSKMPSHRKSASSLRIRKVSKISRISKISKISRYGKSRLTLKKKQNYIGYIDTRIQIIAKMWWWFCQAMPLYRGSAAVGEFIFKAMIELYTEYKYTLRTSRSHSPQYLVDIYALTYDKDEFTAIFKNHFLVPT